MVRSSWLIRLLRRARAPGLALVVRFTLIGLLVGAIAASAAAFYIDDRLTQLMLDQVAARAIDQVELGVLHRVTATDFEAPYPPERLDDIDARLSPLVAQLKASGSELLRLVVYARDGTVLFSSDTGLRRGQVIPIAGTEIAEALEGHVEKEISALDATENADLKASHDEAIEVYVPLVLDGTVVGAYEIYQDSTPIRPVRPLVWSSVLVGFFLLLASVFGVVARGGREIQRHQAERVGLLQEGLDQALHDRLTGLPNRALFTDRLKQAVLSSHRSGIPFALLYLDLDRFKEVNDAFGHETGDELLRAAATRLQSVLRESDSVARVGGDEFAVLLEGVGAVPGWLVVTKKINRSFEETIKLSGTSLQSGASIGVVLYPESGRDADELLRHADVAMYVAKNSRSGYMKYSPDQDPRSEERLRLTADLHQAFLLGGLALYYQPIVDLRSGQCVGAEALLRWTHATRGAIPPLEFIPLAETTGLIHPLSRWVLERGLRDCLAWREAGFDIGISVNLSTPNLRDPDLAQDVRELLTSVGVASHRLTLEITESHVMLAPERTLQVLTQLRGYDVHFSVDDFGTGYSSLTYLQRLPVQEVKVDRSFVADMLTRPTSSAIVRSTIELGHAMGLRVVAEGVEDAATRDALAASGCDFAQGYLFARPMPQADLLSWLQSRTAASEAARPRGEVLV